MSSTELATRLGVTQQAVIDMEQSEQNNTVRLDTLQRAADALDCDLFYALVPRHGLDVAVQEQALRKAARHLSRVAHHSRLEDQSLDEASTRAELEELAASLVDRRGLWSDLPR
jgi:predicted DNA-binding mobile mystery protein A